MELIRVLFSWMVDRERLTSNPAKGIKRLKVSPRQQVWSEEAEEALLAVADEPMQRAFKLMLYTGQRQQDALKLEWTKYVDGRLSVRQRKTWPLIDIPAAANLKVLLNSLPRMSTHVLTDALGRPWTQRAFGSRRRETTLAAGLTDRDLKNMDLPRIAMVRLAEAGATPHEISAISGRPCESLRPTYPGPGRWRTPR